MRVIKAYGSDGSLCNDGVARILGTMLFPGSGNLERQRRHRAIKAIYTSGLPAFQTEIAAGRNVGGELLYQITIHLARTSGDDVPAPTQRQGVAWVRAALLHDKEIEITGLKPNLEAPAWHEARKALKNTGGIKEAKIMADCAKFRLVSHFWAALEFSSYIKQAHRFWITESPENIPRFTALADVLAGHAADIPVRRRRWVLLPADRRWRVTVPEKSRINLALSYEGAAAL